MKTQSKEEDEVKCTVAQQANDSVMLERKRRRLNKNNPDKKPDNNDQNDAPISKRSTVNSINKLTSEVQGPADDDNKNKSRKAWTIEMLMNDGDILTNMTNKVELMSDDGKCSCTPGRCPQITRYNIICIK